MKKQERIEVIDFLGVSFRITYYRGSRVVRLERYDQVGLFKKYKWVNIFMGHLDIFKEVIEFVEEEQELERTIEVQS